MAKKEKPEHFLNTVKRIFSYIGKMNIVLIVALLLSAIAPLSRISGSVFFQIIIDNYLIPLSNNYSNQLYIKFLYTVFILICIFFSGVVIIFIYKQLMVKISTSILYRIRIDLFQKMEKLPIEYFDTNKHGDIMSIYTNDTENIRDFLSSAITDFIYDSVQTIFVIIAMLFYNWMLSIVIGISLLTMFIVSKKFAKTTGRLFKEQQDKLGKLNGYMEEMIEGQKVVKVFNYEERSNDGFEKLNNDLYDVSVKANFFTMALSPILRDIGCIGYSIIVIIGVIFIMNNYVTIGIAIVFFQFSRAIIFPIFSIGQSFTMFMNAMASAERIFNVIDKKDEIDNGKIVLDKDKIIGNIVFDNVTFRYNDKKDTLKNISFTAGPNKKVAFVGSTGAGKTTITNLITRFYDIQEGKITFDGMDVKDIKKSSLRKNISVVLQDTNLFTGTIIENIRYGRMNASDDEIIQAAKLTSADNFIKALKDGYNTVITDSGGSLSQGERQLLSITRAVISDASIIILDESTSSIDTRTEKLIERGLNVLMEGKTVFIIAHRLSTIKNSDEIVVLEHGNIIEKGNHSDLLNNKNRYFQLYNGIIELD
ncbi:MAG: ABC transporter ATP-binding protein/permease [Rickettsiales bacterium]|jgi:ATP-binding cassette subfamily B protein|nr:ABC transporter ATP-binding protein/permease [Rickettsiales bacterium]